MPGCRAAAQVLVLPIPYAMAEFLMALSVTIDLGVGAIINKLDEINERRKKRDENYLMNVSDDLESLDLIIDKLVSIFIDLATGFAQSSQLNNPEKLDALVEATENYINRRTLMNRFNPIYGQIAAAAKDKRVKAHNAEAPERMETLLSDIDQFLRSIAYLGPSGFGYKYLNELLGFADKFKRKELSADEVVRSAKQALAVQNHASVVNIQKSIGTIRQMLR